MKLADQTIIVFSSIRIRFMNNSVVRFVHEQEGATRPEDSGPNQMTEPCGQYSS